MKYKVLSPYVTNDKYYKVGDTLECDPDASASCRLRLQLAVKNGILKRESDKKTIWEIEEGDDYYSMYSDGTIAKCTWQNTWSDKERRSLGNAFLTVEEKERGWRWLKAREILRRDTKGFRPDWNNFQQDKYAPYYCHDSQKFYIDCFGFIQVGEIIFATQEDAEASIKAHEKEWKIYLGVEE